MRSDNMALYRDLTLYNFVYYDLLGDIILIKRNMLNGLAVIILVPVVLLERISISNLIIQNNTDLPSSLTRTITIISVGTRLLLNKPPQSRSSVATMLNRYGINVRYLNQGSCR